MKRTEKFFLQIGSVIWILALLFYFFYFTLQIAKNYTIADEGYFKYFIGNIKDIISFSSADHPGFRVVCQYNLVATIFYIGFLSLVLWRLPKSVSVSRFGAIIAVLVVVNGLLGVSFQKGSSIDLPICNFLNFLGFILLIFILLSTLSGKLFAVLFLASTDKNIPVNNPRYPLPPKRPRANR